MGEAVEQLLGGAGIGEAQVLDGEGGGDDGGCLLYTSDAADDLPIVDLGVRRIFLLKTNGASLFVLLVVYVSQILCAD
ncbi:hypothetical protein NGH33_08625, partial [Micrococcus yunnanensis]